MHNMNSEVESRLNKKLVDVVAHLEKTQEEKKAANSSFNEEIKAARERMNCLADVLKNKDLTKLNGIFFDTEIEQMVKD